MCLMWLGYATVKMDALPDAPQRDLSPPGIKLGIFNLLGKYENPLHWSHQWTLYWNVKTHFDTQLQIQNFNNSQQKEERWILLHRDKTSSSE